MAGKNDKSTYIEESQQIRVENTSKTLLMVPFKFELFQYSTLVPNDNYYHYDSMHKEILDPEGLKVFTFERLPRASTNLEKYLTLVGGRKQYRLNKKHHH